MSKMGKLKNKGKKPVETDEKFMDAMKKLFSIDEASTLTSTTTGGYRGGFVYWNNPTDKFIPTRVIYNPPYTICYFKDGPKEVVKCTDGDEFIAEVGVMACIIKRMFPSRKAFEKLVADGKWQYNDGGLMQDDTYGDR